MDFLTVGIVWFYVCLIGVSLRAANVRGRSVFLYFIACILFSPLIALIDVLVTTADESNSVKSFNTTKSIMDTYKE